MKHTCIMWEYEYKESMRKNGLHSIRFYYKIIDKKIVFVTYKDYTLRKITEEVIHVQNHVGFKHNIDDYTSSIVLFTSQKITKLPKLGSVDNIELKNNIFSYANKIIFFKNADFSLFFTLHENRSDFPIDIQDHSKEHVVKDATRGFFLDSYKACKNEHPLYTYLLYNHLSFKWYMDNTIISSLNVGLLTPRNASLLLKFNTTELYIKNYVEKMERGFKESDLQDLCNSLDWSMPI